MARVFISRRNVMVKKTKIKKVAFFNYGKQEEIIIGSDTMLQF